MGWLQEWTARNDVTEDGDDNRSLVIGLMVPARSEVSMAVAALSGEKAQLLLSVQEPGGVGIALPVQIVPPWGAKKRGAFYFTAVADYSRDRINDLADVTVGSSLAVSIEVLQDELSLEPERQAALDFIKDGTPSVKPQKPRGGAK
ncbi:MAG TPA: hypothetical protein DC063_03740 [Arenimonas sp.]|nr:hypothetical protein [Candidatus Rokubacteria bacterium]HBD19276.1 hypothetical protein [Arenimonas sp.]